MNRLSRIFVPQLIVPKNAAVKNQELTSRSHKLMMETGLMRHCGNGTFYILPLLQRSIEKLTRILDHFMAEIEGQKLTMPTLTSADLWKKTGRFETAQAELMVMKDRHDKLQLLSPTHEESITSLLASISPVSYRNFPLRVYQITPKFRDEMKPRFGLIRAKEFLMKDLYTFDVDLESATETYELVNQQYKKIFDHLRIPFVKIAADTGVMGGKMSHEYHILTPIGEDQIVTCDQCQRAVNKELCLGDGEICEDCSNDCLKQGQGIEIGHTFILGEKYSKVLKATYLSKAGKPVPLQMGCYGVGVTRVIAACIEHLSSDEQIRWPAALAPFTTCIIPPKEGSREEAAVAHLTQEIYQQLDDVVVDDRTSMTIGKRLMEAKKLGIPNIIVIGAKAAETEPKIELVSNDVSRDLTICEAINAVKANKVELS